MIGILKRVMWILLVFFAGLLLLEIVSVFKLRDSVNDYKNHWERQISMNTDSDSLQYIALGDSAAQGVGASKPDKGYVGLIAGYLEQRSGKKVRVINLSVSGAKISDVIEEQLPTLKTLKNDDSTYITLDIGANDMKDFNAQEFRKNLSTLFAQLPSKTVVADIPYFGGGIFRSREKNAVVASEIVRELANKYGLTMAELHETTKTNDSLKNYAADLFHPNNRGYRNWFNAYVEALNI